jgi:hypothetical protein
MLEYYTLKALKIAAIFVAAVLFLYTVFGTFENVDDIKAAAPTEFAKRNWTILRYEGYEYGSWYTHGGKVWYHVANTDNHDIQYRVSVTSWYGELQYYYGGPEQLIRVNR